MALRHPPDRLKKQLMMKVDLERNKSFKDQMERLRSTAPVHGEHLLQCTGGSTFGSLRQ